LASAAGGKAEIMLSDPGTKIDLGAFSGATSQGIHDIGRT